MFTVELESDSSTACLDVKVIRAMTGTLRYSIYRKPIHTDGFLNFRSVHSVQPKYAVVCTHMSSNQTPASDKRKEKLKSCIKICITRQ